MSILDLILMLATYVGGVFTPDRFAEPVKGKATDLYVWVKIKVIPEVVSEEVTDETKSSQKTTPKPDDGD